MPTIHTDETTQGDLRLYCKKLGISQGDFVKFSLVYFRKSGIHPADPPESVREEVAKVEKRISQLIAFQKTFEDKQLLPLFRVLTETKEKIHENFKNVPEELKAFEQTTKNFQYEFIEFRKGYSKAVTHMASLIDKFDPDSMKNIEKVQAAERREAQLFNRVNILLAQVDSLMKYTNSNESSIGKKVTINDCYLRDLQQNPQ